MEKEHYSIQMVHILKEIFKIIKKEAWDVKNIKMVISIKDFGIIIKEKVKDL